MFATADEEYFVEPLWNSTIDKKSMGNYHVVYKRSSFNRAHQENHCGVSGTRFTIFLIRQNVDSPQTNHSSMSKVQKKAARKKVPSVLFLVAHLSDLHPGPFQRSKVRWLANQNEINKVDLPHKKGKKKRNWRRKRHKRSVSKRHYVETLVVVDKTMIEYHGKSEIEPYILTVMNIVSCLRLLTAFLSKLFACRSGLFNLEFHSLVLNAGCKLISGFKSGKQRSDASHKINFTHRESRKTVLSFTDLPKMLVRNEEKLCLMPEMRKRNDSNVRISLLQPDLLITHHAGKSLESFCKWQASVNPTEGQESLERGTAHHDNAILITR